MDASQPLRKSKIKNSKGDCAIPSESEIVWNTTPDFEEVISDIGSNSQVNPSLEQKVELQFRGVSLEFLKEIFGRGEEFRRADGNGLKTILTLPETKTLRCSVAELYKNHLGSLSNQPLIGKVRFFISHAWRYKFSELVEAIERFELACSDREGAYYFIDYFAINQWKATEELSSLEFLIRGSEALVLVISPLIEPIPMTRCWCLYELNISLKWNIPIHATVPDNQLSWLRGQLITTMNLVDLTKFKIESKCATASKQFDEDMIKTAIWQSNGFAWLDMEVYKAVVSYVRILALSQLHNWESKMIQTCLEQQISSLVDQTSSELKRYNQLIELESQSNFPRSSLNSMEELFTERILGEEESKFNVVPFECKAKVIPAVSKYRFWNFCFSTSTAPESLAQLFSLCFEFIIIGELLDISSIILQYIGGCGCNHWNMCSDCAIRCTCTSQSKALCDICSSKGITRCKICKRRITSKITYCRTCSDDEFVDFYEDLPQMPTLEEVQSSPSLLGLADIQHVQPSPNLTPPLFGMAFMGDFSDSRSSVLSISL